MPYYSRSISKRGLLAHSLASAIDGKPKPRKPVGFDSSDPRQIECANIRRLLARESADFATSERLRARLTQLTIELGR